MPATDSRSRANRRSRSELRGRSPRADAHHASPAVLQVRSAPTRCRSDHSDSATHGARQHGGVQASTFGTPQQRCGCQRRNHNRFLRLNNFLDRLSRRGKEAVVGVLSAGQFFGEAALNGQRVRISTATTMADSRIVRITRSAMLDLLNHHPEFSEFFIHHLLSRNLRIEEDLVDQLFNSSEKRLARILLLLANFGKEGKPETVIPDITQATLAEMIGTTRSRVSFFLNKFRKLGFI